MVEIGVYNFDFINMNNAILSHTTSLSKIIHEGNEILRKSETFYALGGTVDGAHLGGDLDNFACEIS